MAAAPVSISRLKGTAVAVPDSTQGIARHEFEARAQPVQEHRIVAVPTGPVTRYEREIGKPVAANDEAQYAPALPAAHETTIAGSAQIVVSASRYLIGGFAGTNPARSLAGTLYACSTPGRSL